MSKRQKDKKMRKRYVNLPLTSHQAIEGLQSRCLRGGDLGECRVETGEGACYFLFRYCFFLDRESEGRRGRVFFPSDGIVFNDETDGRTKNFNSFQTSRSPIAFLRPSAASEESGACSPIAAAVAGERDDGDETPLSEEASDDAIGCFSIERQASFL